jgi:hypothetical protein
LLTVQLLSAAFLMHVAFGVVMSEGRDKLVLDGLKCLMSWRCCIRKIILKVIVAEGTCCMSLCEYYSQRVMLHDVYVVSRFDCWMILAQCAFNTVDKLYTNVGGRIISIDELNALSHGHEENEMLFQFQAKLQKLRMNEEENCILAAMCVMTTGLSTKIVPVI